MIKMYFINRISFLVIVGIIFLVPIPRVSASVIWQEDFSTLDDWVVGYWNSSSGVFVQEAEPGFTLQNGIMTAPNVQGTFDLNTMAVHNSSMVYGTWAFDWVITSGVDHLAYDVCQFIYNDTEGDYDPTGETWDEFLENNTGYGVLMISSDATAAPSHFVKPGIQLLKYGGGDPGVLNQYQFPADLAGTYHFEITRNNTGEFRLYLDDDFLFSATDTDHTTSERFLIGSAKGDSGFDNVTVDDTITDHVSPEIGPFSHFPSVPDASESIYISTNVTDDYEVQSVDLYYRVDGGAWSSIAMPRYSPLWDEYNTTIGPFPAESEVEYYVKAVDSSSNEALSPTESFTVASTTTTTPPTTTTTDGTSGFSFFLLCLSLVVIYIRKRRR